MKIRPARTTDAPRLSALARAAKRHWGYPDEWLRLWDPELTVTADTIRRQHVFCAEEGDSIVGFYAVSAAGPAAELEHMWIEPRSFGRGIGSRLLAHALDQAATRGIRSLRIASDPNAEGFYVRRGARRIGTVPSTPEGRHLPLLEVAIPRRNDVEIPRRNDA